MSDGYLTIYERFPEFLKRRINPLEYALRRFVRQASLTSLDGLVLDAGAGESRFRPFFDRHRYVAVDSGVGDAGWDYGHVDSLADLSRLPFKSDSFHLALNTQVLEHVPDPQAVIDELFRVLRPGGQLFLSAPQGWPEHQQPHDFYRFTSFALWRMMRRAGFQTVEIEPLGGYFHYLGHRATYIPKILFQHRRGLGRILLFPLEFLCLGICCFLTPLLCYYLDRLDTAQEFTLLYSCRAGKADDHGRAAGEGDQSGRS